jgi:hypothetical protein
MLVKLPPHAPDGSKSRMVHETKFSLVAFELVVELKIENMIGTSQIQGQNLQNFLRKICKILVTFRCIC